jgi:peptidoglycan hydrolase-like protein with peptidoglycan-binding domain
LSERPVLRVGAAGSAVGELQQSLSAAGIPDAGEPYRFTAETERAVREFQTKRGLRVDGVCGPETWNDLSRAVTSSGAGCCSSARRSSGATTSQPSSGA